MASPSPSTPANRFSAPATPQTGTWRHPQFDEIARRQNKGQFTDRNVRKVVWNCIGLFFVWVTRNLIRESLSNFYVHPFESPPLTPDPAFFIWLTSWLIRAVLFSNIAVAILPLVRTKDNLADIPLTPGQRALLGLEPSNTPLTAGSQYVTPPRYPRSSTPLSSTPNSSYSNSPVSGRPSPSQGTPSKGSPFSPNASPLLHKAIGGIAGGRRSSYGSPSPLGPGSSGMAPSTPTPAGSGKATSVGLNSRWLYEKGRRTSGSTKLFS